MWKCLICQTEIEDDSWQECWKCSYDRGTPHEEVDSLKALQRNKENAEISCVRCEAKSEYAGTKRFHEGSNLGFIFGDWGHLFENHERYDVYVCRTCGKVEFFIDGIGDAQRGEKM